MSYKDEFGIEYVFKPLYDAYSNLGEPESTALRQVLKNAGFMGFAELCDRAKMLCYEIDSEYGDAHPSEWAKATRKSISKPTSFNDMVKSVREEHLEKDAHDFKVGDILVSSWGYDQTNVDFYQVVGVTPKSVKIREIKAKVLETGFMSGESVPIPDAFVDNIWFGEQKIARVSPHGWVNITSDGRITAEKWNGEPEYVSWYA